MESTKEKDSGNRWDSEKKQLNLASQDLADLRNAANPFSFSIDRLVDKYVFRINGTLNQSGFAKREISFLTMVQEDNHMLMLKNMIGDMKSELTRPSVRSNVKSKVKIGSGDWVDVDEAKVSFKPDSSASVKSNPSNSEPKLVHISCPVHGNPMMRRSENDPRLYCTVYGCTKRAKPKAPVEPAEEVVTVDSGGSAATAEDVAGALESLKAAADEKALALSDGQKVEVEKLVQLFDRMAKQQASKYIPPPLRPPIPTAPNSQTPLIYGKPVPGIADCKDKFLANGEPVRIVNDGGRYYLVQSIPGVTVGGTLEVRIDITNYIRDCKVNQSYVNVGTVQNPHATVPGLQEIEVILQGLITQ